jgi:hypothetical protein
MLTHIHCNKKIPQQAEFTASRKNLSCAPWGVTDLFNLDAPLTLRTGDSIKVVALPELPASGEQTTELLLNGRSIHHGPSGTPKIIRFDKPGVHRLHASVHHDGQDGQSLTTDAEIRVLAADFGAPVSIASGVTKAWHLPAMDKLLELQADPDLEWIEVRQTASDGRHLRLSHRHDAARSSRIIARLPGQGAIAATTTVSGFRIVDSARSLDAHVIDVLPDGTRLVEIGIAIDGEIPPDLSIWIEFYVTDAVFANGETRWQLTAADFGENGIAKITILKAPGTGVAAVCHWLHVGQDPPRQQD